jgi:SAM-dependent MidA family methyltransferase
VPSASDEVHAAIAAAGGEIRFDEYMRIALYGEHGFYTAGGQAGRRGDFITSPEVGPLFGVVLARWIEAHWQSLGEPDDFVVVECGAGPGTLARSILTAGPQWAERYVAVEVSARQRANHPSHVRSVAALPAAGPPMVVIANELLDNLPFRLVVFDGAWREVALATDRDGRLIEVTIAADPTWGWLPSTAPHGARLPIHDDAAAWIGAARRLGTVIAFDYCTSATAELAAMPWRDWLRTYRGHGRGEHYLRNVGEQDITAQVCLDQLPSPTMVMSQIEFLRQWGIDELVEHGRQAWLAAAARPDLTAMRMRSRVVEADALLAVDGLGSFAAVSWAVVQ